MADFIGALGVRGENALNYHLVDGDQIWETMEMLGK